MPKKKPKQFKQPDLSPYAGEWVAVLGNKVVAHSKHAHDLKDLVVKDARDKIPAEEMPMVIKVPREDEGPYIL